MSNDTHRRAFGRVHNDLFSGGRYSAELYNYPDPSAGDYDPDTGTITDGSRQTLGTHIVEIVPPNMDTTVDTDGTNLSWDTSIRFPFARQDLTVESGETYTVESGDTEEYNAITVESNATLKVDGTLVGYGTLTVNGTLDNNGTVVTWSDGTFGETIRTLGDDNKRPTEVEITDEVGNDTTVYELHGYQEEKGNGMIMCRLVEQ